VVTRGAQSIDIYHAYAALAPKVDMHQTVLEWVRQQAYGCPLFCQHGGAQLNQRPR
jgi:hypothetical protein